MSRMWRVLMLKSTLAIMHENSELISHLKTRDRNPTVEYKRCHDKDIMKVERKDAAKSQTNADINESQRKAELRYPSNEEAEQNEESETTHKNILRHTVTKADINEEIIEEREMNDKIPDNLSPKGSLPLFVKVDDARILFKASLPQEESINRDEQYYLSQEETKKYMGKLVQNSQGRKIYVANENDTPRLIAEKFGVSVTDLLDINQKNYPSMTQRSKCMSGTQILLMPDIATSSQVTISENLIKHDPIVHNVSNRYTPFEYVALLKDAKKQVFRIIGREGRLLLLEPATSSRDEHMPSLIGRPTHLWVDTQEVIKLGGGVHIRDKKEKTINSKMSENAHKNFDMAIRHVGGVLRDPQSDFTDRENILIQRSYALGFRDGTICPELRNRYNSLCSKVPKTGKGIPSPGWTERRKYQLAIPFQLATQITYDDESHLFPEFLEDTNPDEDEIEDDVILKRQRISEESQSESIHEIDDDEEEEDQTEVDFEEEWEDEDENEDGDGDRDNHETFYEKLLNDPSNEILLNDFFCDESWGTFSSC